jgi:hypothetical protein
MPGYARPTSILVAQEIIVTPTGDISSTNLQSALTEIAGEKATTTSVTNVQNNLDVVNTDLSQKTYFNETMSLLFL